MPESQPVGPSAHQRHRARRRRTQPAEEPAEAAAATETIEAETAEPRDADRALRGLVGAGPSQLTLSAAMRARDASQPTAEDLAEVEAELVVIRRQYVPTESLPAGIRPAARPRKP